MTDIQLEFRDKYKHEITNGEYGANFNDFKSSFDQILRNCEEWARNEASKVKAPRSYHETEKAQSKVSSMIEKKTNILGNLLGNSNNTTSNESKSSNKAQSKKQNVVDGSVTVTTNSASSTTVNGGSGSGSIGGGDSKEDRENIQPVTPPLSPQQKIMRKFEKPTKKAEAAKKPEPTKKGKQNTKWGDDVVEAETLDFSDEKAKGATEPSTAANNDEPINSQKYADQDLKGKMKGELKGIDVDDDDDDDSEKEIATKKSSVKVKNGSAAASSSSSFGFLSSLKNLVGGKVLTKETIEPIMEKMQEHLVAKNVAAEIANKLCDSVAANLEGKQIGTFEFAANIVKQAMHDSLVQILTPKRRINILRDIMEAKSRSRPYVIVFCGVNGVGKSTNLAKVTFWLIENSNRVLIAACDTFRAGAVEQLRTHTRHLNALHPPEAHQGRQMVELYEKGYGKDAAGIAFEAINYARNNRHDVVLVDTAGRMQDNEPLMKALAKLININQPDLVLFVGEALVGNEAVDQVKKFNQALYDNSKATNSNEQARLIDGIVLTKFDTIDDKVGAAISMTYTTGQPIVFVGTGQTYADLKNLNSEAVVKALLK